MYDGKVIDVDSSFLPGQYAEISYGNYVIIESVINGQTIHLQYAHLNSLNVGRHKEVVVGELIGYSGKTGNAAHVQNAHLHIRSYGKRKKS